MAGLTATGFVAKTQEEILDEIETEQKANISSTLNVKAGPIQQINGTMSGKLRELWELGEEVYNASYPDSANDQPLTEVASITGTTREAAEPSTVACNCDIDAATTVNPGDLVAHVDGNPDARFVNVEGVASAPGGVISLDFESEETGPIAANAGTLTEIAEPFVGWNSVTNPLDAVLGEEIESDADLRVRREDELAETAAATEPAIKADLFAMDGMEQVRVDVNDENITVDGLPPHSFEAVIFDGITPAIADDDIAQQIWNSKGAGIKTHGDDSGTATDSEGFDHTMAFTRATVVAMYLEIDLDTDDDYPIDGDDQVKTAVAAILYQMGEDVILTALHPAIFSVAGVVDVLEIRVGIAASPTQTTNWAIDSKDIADHDTSRIEINPP
jgi:uncharacterized phage protein gp47/JayE